MQCEVTVLSEEPQTYQGKNGMVSLLRLVVLDNDIKTRFRQTFDYDLEKEERDKYAGKLVGKRLTLGIVDMVTFGGRLRARGSIVAVDGAVTSK